jgi:hypothetical protein
MKKDNLIKTKSIDEEIEDIINILTSIVKTTSERL